MKWREAYEQAELSEALAELRAAKRVLRMALRARLYLIVHAMNVRMERAITRLERRHPRG